jgi:hypothetical protein
MSDKPSAAWYLAPIFLGIIGSAIMWYVLKDEDHPDAPKMVKKGWVIGIVLTIIPFLMLIPMLLLIPMTSTGGFDQQPMQERMEVIPEPRVIPVPAPTTQKEPEPEPQQVPEPTQRQAQEPSPEPIQTQNSCDSSYPDVCIPVYPPDLDCDEISYSNFRVIQPDPHGFDRNNDGVGCEVGSPSEPIQPTQENECDPSYPDVCIAVYPPDLDCGEIQYSNFKVIQPDPHGFDRDQDGIGCES